MNDYLTAADRLAPRDAKLRAAITYLRDRNKYALDQPVRRIKPSESRTVLDQWLRGKR